jgi:hypothetical protein
MNGEKEGNDETKNDGRNPFVSSQAEEDYEELLLSPERRNRLRNKRLRRVHVGIRVRPFLPHEEPDSVLAVRGNKNLMLVNPLVFPGASSELVADMVLAGSKADMDLSDWVRPFEFGSCLWSLKPPEEAAVPSSDTAVEFCDQVRLYNELGKPLVDSLFEGVHISAFAYGMTGSGKTYSMIGADPLALHLATSKSYGLIPSALIDMMDRAAELWKLTQIPRTQEDASSDDDDDEEDLRPTTPTQEDVPSSVSMRMSIMEVYNDRLRDLLSPNRDTQPLRIREDPLSGPYATGLECVTIDLSEPKEARDSMVLQLLSVASAIRVTADNSSAVEGGSSSSSSGARNKKASSLQGHETSSRGHALVNVDLEISGITTRAQLVDLAGSERSSGDVASSGPLGKRGRITESSPTTQSTASAKVQQQRQRERIEIGRSLSNLNVIINGLAKGDDPASLPFRECKMTWLLKQGLAMDAHVVMLGTVSPSAGSYEETMQTLLYAERLQRMKNAATSATPLKQLIDQSLVTKVLNEPLELLQRISEFQQEQQQLKTTKSSSVAGGLSTPTRSSSSSFSSSSASDSSRKASMRGLEVSDPRQRLVRLTDFLRRLAYPHGPPPDIQVVMQAAAASAISPTISTSGLRSPHTPSRNTVRSQVLPTSRSGTTPPASPPPQQRGGGMSENDPDMLMMMRGGDNTTPSGGGGGDPRVEVSRLRNANANLEMELHAVKVDRDVLELRVTEGRADVTALRQRCKELEQVESRATTLQEANEVLQHQLSGSHTEVELLRRELMELREENARCLRAASEKEAEVVYLSRRFQEEEQESVAERFRLEQLNQLAVAWHAWRCAVSCEISDVKPVFMLESGARRLTPPASPSHRFE